MFHSSMFKLVWVRQRPNRVRQDIKCCTAQEQRISLKSMVSVVWMLQGGLLSTGCSDECQNKLAKTLLQL